MRNQKYILLLSFLLVGRSAFCQNVAINADGSAPDASSILDLKSANKGLLVPRVTRNDRNAIVNPAAGLLVYQTNDSIGFFYNEGPAVNWKYLSAASLPNTDFGFSASVISALISGGGTVLINGWTVSSPFFSTAGFNPSVGAFIVPSTGVYEISATIPYSLSAPVTVSQSAAVNPAFEIRRQLPVPATLLTGTAPIFDINSIILTFRSVLASAVVPVQGTLLLTAGDIIGLYYNPNGLNLSLNLKNVVWSVRKLQ